MVRNTEKNDILLFIIIHSINSKMKRKFNDNHDSDDEDNNQTIIGMIQGIIENNFNINKIIVKFDNTHMNNEEFYSIIMNVCELLHDDNKLILNVIGDKISILYKFKEIDLMYMNDNYDCITLIEIKN